MPTEVTDAQIEESLKLCEATNIPAIGKQDWYVFANAAHIGWPATLAALKTARARVVILEAEVNRLHIKLFREEGEFPGKEI